MPEIQIFNSVGWFDVTLWVKVYKKTDPLLYSSDKKLKFSLKTYALPYEEE